MITWQQEQRYISERKVTGRKQVRQDLWKNKSMTVKWITMYLIFNYTCATMRPTVLDHWDPLER